MKYLLKSSTFLTFCVALAGPAMAQPAADAGADAQTTNGDIIVTASKREEALRDVPITISAVTAEQITATGPILGTGDLLRTIPGVRFNGLQSENLAEISIRGSGTARATSADSGVGLFVNGAYAGSSTLGGRNFKRLDYFDLARVEVLKGPQSALYGRNSEYGVVNIVLQKPLFEDSGAATATYIGKLGQTQLETVVNKNLGDGFAVRLGAQVTGQSSGFYYNPDNGRNYDHTDGWILRGQLRYQHGPLDVTLLVDGQDMKLPTFINQYVIPAGQLAALPQGYTGPRYAIPSSGIDSLRQKEVRTQLIASYDFGWGVLTSTTMALRSESAQSFSAALDLATEASFQSQGWAGLYPLTQTSTFARDKTLYQDLHLAGTALGHKLSWLAGVEGLAQNDYYVLTSATNPCTLTATSGICGGTPATPICYELLSTSRPCPTPFPASFGTRSATTSTYRSAAAYGSLKYSLGQFQIGGELRYSYDSKKATRPIYSLYTDILQGTPPSYQFDGGNLSYGATASYALPGTLKRLLYAKLGSGYRAGGVNNGLYNAAAPNPFRPSYGDERTLSFELGAKAEITRRIYAQAAAFTSRTTNAITSLLDGCTVLNACHVAGTYFNINGGTIRSRGAELSLDGNFDVAGGKLTLAANGVRQTARFIDVPTGIVGGPVLGSLAAQTPKWTMSGTLGYAHSVARNVDGFFNATYSGQRGGGQDTVTAATPFIPLSDIDTVDLKVGVNYQRFTVAFFVQNLTDQVVPVLRLQQGAIPLSNRYLEPRTFGGSISYKW